MAVQMLIHLYWLTSKRLLLYVLLMALPEGALKNYPG